MLATKSLSFTQNLDKAISEFKTTNEKDPDFLIIHAQMYHDYLAVLNEEERIHNRFGRPKYLNTVLILTSGVERNEIIPVIK